MHDNGREPALERRAVAERLRQLCREADAGRADRDGEVLALAEAVQRSHLVGAEADLDVRARTAVRLLEHGRPSVALDVVRHGLDAQPLVTCVRNGRAYGWLPGFGDPRAAVPDDVYDLSDRVVLRRGLEEVRWQDGKVVLAGFAHLRHLIAGPDDEVSLVLRRLGNDTVVRVRAERCRRPGRVDLAWSGFRADLDLRALGGPATWRVAVEVTQDGITRTRRLRPAPGSEVARLRAYGVPGPRWASRVAVARGGQRLTVAPRRLLPVAPRRLLPAAPVRSLRRLLRRLV